MFLSAQSILLSSAAAGAVTTVAAGTAAALGIPGDLLQQLPQFAGVLALAAFGGTFLGGILLSMFWKRFGPWKMLDESHTQLQRCESERIADIGARVEMTATYERKIALVQAELADYKTRQEIIMDAIRKGGLGLKLVPNFTEIDPHL